MAFYLHTAEVDKARAIAERGLTTISFRLSFDYYICSTNSFFYREEQEKFNLWIGLMNLENLYGSQDSLVKVFQRAIQQNEPLMVYCKLTNIYETSNKIDVS